MVTLRSAVKQLRFPEDDPGYETGAGPASREVEAMEREILMCQKLRHRHIVGYLSAQRLNHNEIFVFLEYVPGGSIASMLRRFGVFREDLCRHYTRQLLLGLEYLHGHKIVHRDLKGANLLVSRDGVVKLADFGAAKAFCHDATTLTDGFKSMQGSLFWMSPEVIKGAGYGRRADVWSVGCTVIEMLTGTHPWPEMESSWGAIFAISRSTEGPPIPEVASNLARTFLRLCFRYESADRPTASQLLQHEFVARTDAAVSEAQKFVKMNRSIS